MQKVSPAGGTGKRESERDREENAAAQKRIGTGAFTSDQIRRYFQSYLLNQRLGTGPQVNVRCPFHDDKTPSMSLNLEKGIWNCHGECNTGGGLLDFEQRLTDSDKQTAWNAIYAAMEIPRTERAGIDQREPQAVYSYVDDDGALLFEIVRYPVKNFKMRRPDGKGGWIWNLDGVPRVLYNLPALRHADVAFITEGEKDADTLTTKLRLDKERSKGRTWVATTNSGGAGNWNRRDGKKFKDKFVIVLEDNDDAGRERSDVILASVYPYARKVKLIRLPELKSGFDVSDWLQAHSPRELLGLINETERWHPVAQDEDTITGKRRTLDSPRHEPVATAQPVDILRADLVCLADVEARAVDWLWEPYIPARMLTMISGDPGAGKTFLALAVAAQLTRGRRPDGLRCPPCDVICLTVENAPEEVLRPRFDALRGNARRFHLLRGTVSNENGEVERRAISLSDVGRIDQAITQTNARLVIVDPIQSYLGAQVDMHRANQTRPVLDGLAKLAEKHNCSILLLRHITKQSGGKAIHRGLGSIDLTGAVRSELLVGSLPEDPDSRAMVHIKSNIGPMGPSIGYEIDDDGHFSWIEGHCDITAAQLLEAPANASQLSQLDSAVNWLKQELAAGPRWQTDLQEAAKASGCSWPTVRRAQKKLKIKSRKAGMRGGWIWALSKDGGDGS